MHKAKFLRTTQAEGITNAATDEEAMGSRRTKTTEDESVIVARLLSLPYVTAHRQSMYNVCPSPRSFLRNVTWNERKRKEMI
jgi:hypothetical protein